jgi:hypothetical protein
MKQQPQSTQQDDLQQRRQQIVEQLKQMPRDKALQLLQQLLSEEMGEEEAE